ncbi:hypothetical protein C8F04DRAFT_1188299 [Mycena alexandri]|uniref:Secreted protein n=1 Tax=Mycena alexandri TaxID=1745969 RepID=A0AAD6WVH0_9AGAR|nr:hypothetical protein C8F04DRAFT_1188299 [Mycena alexandri]
MSVIFAFFLYLRSSIFALRGRSGSIGWADVVSGKFKPKSCFGPGLMTALCSSGRPRWSEVLIAARGNTGTTVKGLANVPRDVWSHLPPEVDVREACRRAGCRFRKLLLCTCGVPGTLSMCRHCRFSLFLVGAVSVKAGSVYTRRSHERYLRVRGWRPRDPHRLPPLPPIFLSRLHCFCIPPCTPCDTIADSPLFLVCANGVNATFVLGVVVLPRWRGSHKCYTFVRLVGVPSILTVRCHGRLDVFYGQCGLHGHCFCVPDTLGGVLVIHSICLHCGLSVPRRRGQRERYICVLDRSIGPPASSPSAVTPVLPIFFVGADRMNATLVVS